MQTGNVPIQLIQRLTVCLLSLDLHNDENSTNAILAVLVLELCIDAEICDAISRNEDLSPDIAHIRQTAEEREQLILEVPLGMAIWSSARHSSHRWKLVFGNPAVALSRCTWTGYNPCARSRPIAATTPYCRSTIRSSAVPT